MFESRRARSAYEYLLLFCCWGAKRGAKRPSRCLIAARNKPISPRGDPPLYEDPAAWQGSGEHLRPLDADADSVIWRASPFAIGRRQVTVTECNQQTVTDWLQYAHTADSARLGTTPTMRAAGCRSPSYVPSPHVRRSRRQTVVEVESAVLQTHDERALTCVLPEAAASGGTDRA